MSIPCGWRSAVTEVCAPRVCGPSTSPVAWKSAGGFRSSASSFPPVAPQRRPEIRVRVRNDGSFSSAVDRLPAHPAASRTAEAGTTSVRESKWMAVLAAQAGVGRSPSNAGSGSGPLLLLPSFRALPMRRYASVAGADQFSHGRTMKQVGVSVLHRLLPATVACQPGSERRVRPAVRISDERRDLSAPIPPADFGTARAG